MTLGFISPLLLTSASIDMRFFLLSFRFSSLPFSIASTLGLRR